MLVDGGPNLVSWSPHPNPPPLAFPPLCVSPFVGGQEPTAVDHSRRAEPVGRRATRSATRSAGIPPDGLISSQGTTFFQGPSRAGTVPCPTYGLRQQIGHYLYVVDRSRREVVVLNSNRMTVIDRILLSDPTSLAISPNLDVLAVTNQTTDLVSLIDIDPSSASFHTVIKELLVGEGPRGVAWDPGNEDIMVCNEASNSVSIISAFSLEVRKEVSANLTQPFDVAITPAAVELRLPAQRLLRLHPEPHRRRLDLRVRPEHGERLGLRRRDRRDGAALHEPEGHPTRRARAAAAACGSCTKGPLDPASGQLVGGASEGAATNLVVDSGIVGPIPLSVQALSIPNFRDMNIAIKVSMGEERLSGRPGRHGVRQPVEPRRGDQLPDQLQRRHADPAERQGPGALDAEHQQRRARQRPALRLLRRPEPAAGLRGRGT